MKQSYLTNERIYLRAVEPEDMDIMYEMENDPSMWDISNFTVPYSRYVLRQYIEGSQCDVFADKQLRLMIVSKSDHGILGTIEHWPEALIWTMMSYVYLVPNMHTRQHR